MNQNKWPVTQPHNRLSLICERRWSLETLGSSSSMNSTCFESGEEFLVLAATQPLRQGTVLTSPSLSFPSDAAWHRGQRLRAIEHSIGYSETSKAFLFLPYMDSYEWVDKKKISTKQDGSAVIMNRWEKPYRFLWCRFTILTVLSVETVSRKSHC